MAPPTSNPKHDIPKRESMAVISIVLTVLWAIILVLRAKLSGLSDGVGSSEFSPALLLPFLVFGAGWMGCVSDRSLLFPCGVAVLLGIILISIVCLLSDGTGIFLTIFVIGYGLLWWSMCRERKNESKQTQNHDE